MPRDENIDRLIREKLDHLYVDPPDFIWDNIAKNPVNSQSLETIDQKIDQAVKSKLDELVKAPPGYVWTHIQYYLELHTIWQNIKRILLWQRVKRTLKTILSALTILVLFEYPLNDYNNLNTLFPQTAKYDKKQYDERYETLGKTNTNKHYNTQTAENKSSVDNEKNLIVQASDVEASNHHLSNEKQRQSLNYIPEEISFGKDSNFTTQNIVDNVADDYDQMVYLPPIKPRLTEPDAPELKQTNFSYYALQDDALVPLWQVDIGTQFSVIVSNYLFQSLFSNEFVTVNPGFISSFYVGRIIPSRKYIYRIGLVYGGFASKTSILIDGRWHKETLESRYIGLSGSIGKLILTTGYKRWIDGWLNTSVIYFTSQLYSSEIVRSNPPSNKVGILISGEVSYVRGLSNGDMFLIGGRINALPMNLFKQKGMGKFINLELHIGVRL